VPAGPLRQLIKCASAADPQSALAGSRALFQVLVEGLADLFEPRLCDAYAEIFSEAIAFLSPVHKPAGLFARYRRVRAARHFTGDASRIRQVFVLSRVTLGADVAVTSVMLDAAKRRFPKAEVCFVGAEKNWQLFAADPRLRWLPVSYGRAGTLRDRLAVWPELIALLTQPAAVVIDPDSRLTQLGLLPVCPEENYYLFESRAYGGDGLDSLTTLARRWAAAVFDVPDAAPYAAPAEQPVLPDRPFTIVNLGVGENPAKSMPHPFEEDLLRALLRQQGSVVVDLGAGQEEEQRARMAISRCGASDSQVRPWRGSFAALTAMIAASRLYVGYDSGGQHAAAACGTPLVTVFAGFASPRMFARWYPTGPGPKEVVRVERADPAEVLDRTLAAVHRLVPGPAR
jgi:ADP-heptose:LPS heptosyltransferase